MAYQKKQQDSDQSFQWQIIYHSVSYILVPFVFTTNFESYSCRPTSLTMQSTADNSFVKKLQSSGRSLVVFYGSQTGTGEEFAGRLAKEGVRYRLKGMVADPEECDMVSLKIKIKY